MRHGARFRPPAGERIGSASATERPPAPAPGNAASGGGGAFQDEALTEYDPIEGHNHDGANSRLVPIAGDVTGDNADTTVEKIHGIPVTAPVAADDEKVLSYEHSGPSFEWVSPTGGSDLHLLGVWSHADISAISAFSDDQLTNVWAAALLSEVCPVNATVTHMTMRFTGAPGGVATTNYLEVKVYVGGVLTSFVDTHDSAATSRVTGAGSVSVVAGDVLDVRARQTGTLNPVGIEVKVYGQRS